MGELDDKLLALISSRLAISKAWNLDSLAKLITDVARDAADIGMRIERERCVRLAQGCIDGDFLPLDGPITELIVAIRKGTP